MVRNIEHDIYDAVSLQDDNSQSPQLFYTDFGYHKRFMFGTNDL